MLIESLQLRSRKGYGFYFKNIPITNESLKKSYDEMEGYSDVHLVNVTVGFGDVSHGKAMDF